jgi:hypothetical protein
VSELVHQLRITLRDTKPPIWRRVVTPASTTLGQLHEIIQIVMGWTDCHLHHFVLRDRSLRPGPEEIRQAMEADHWPTELADRMRGERYFVPRATPFGDATELDGEDEDAVTLAQVCPQVKSKLSYEYDFGDGWEHTIEVQKIEEAREGVEYPVCLAGKLACPPEDCGGVHGYYQMLEVAADPSHEDHEDVVEWLGDDFDPEAFDFDAVNDVLAQWRRAQKKQRKKKPRGGGGA